MSKPMIVGEANPYGGDSYFAMYPEPRMSAGGRLCRLILKMEPRQYLHKFDRVNLCPEKWSVPIARANAQRIRFGDQRVVIMLGARVTRALGFEYKPFTTFETTSPGKRFFVCLPHPSGLNRIWNEYGSFQRASDEVNAALATKASAGNEEKGGVIAIMAWNQYREVTAAKQHPCAWCKTTPIANGEKHFRFVGKFEGDFQDWRIHPECRTVAHDTTPDGEGMCEEIHQRGEPCEYCIEWLRPV